MSGWRQRLVGDSRRRCGPGQCPAAVVDSIRSRVNMTHRSSRVAPPQSSRSSPRPPSHGGSNARRWECTRAPAASRERDAAGSAREMKRCRAAGAGPRAQPVRDSTAAGRRGGIRPAGPRSEASAAVRESASGARRRPVRERLRSTTRCRSSRCVVDVAPEPGSEEAPELVPEEDEAEEGREVADAEHLGHEGGGERHRGEPHEPDDEGEHEHADLAHRAQHEPPR